MIHVVGLPRRSFVALAATAGLVLGGPGCLAPRVRWGPSRSRPAEALDPERAADALVDGHNQVRSERGLRLLAVAEPLRIAARRHAGDMAGRRRMSHRGGDGSSPFARITRAGYRFAAAGENVAAGQSSVSEVMGDWMSSPGHRRNILGRFSEIGAACATDAGGTAYWCVTFGNPEVR